MTDSTAAERVGRYQLLEPLGAGPTGLVSRAKVFGVAGFERQFAVKRFLPEVAATGPAAQALSAAARAYGNLEHPRIARMTEFGVSRGTTFTAVELVAGIDALRLITETRLAGATLAAGGALALVSQAARAVGYAHGRGISHLGLAPTNVIVTVDGDVKITDFAVLASTLPTRPVDAPRLAQRIAYLAPEQIAGEATSAATDVFALGVLAYELITARRAFDGDTPARVAQAVVTGLPSELPLPRPIVRVVQRCLSRSPFERFPDARALADALDAALRVAPVPGSRKDVGAVVKELVERLAALREGQMSGMLALDVNTAPRSRATSDAPDDDDETRWRAQASSSGAPAAATSALATGADATQPDLPRPMTTVTGLAPPPIPVPPGISSPAQPSLPSIPMPGAATTLAGMKPDRAAPNPGGAGMQIPTIRPRSSSGASHGGLPRASTPPPVTPLVEAIAAAVPAATFDDETVMLQSGTPPDGTVVVASLAAVPVLPVVDDGGTPIARNEATPRPTPMPPAIPDRARRAQTPPSLFAVSPAGDQAIADAAERGRTIRDVRTDPGVGIRPTAPSLAVASAPTVYDSPTHAMPPMLADQLKAAARAPSDAYTAVMVSSDDAVAAAIDAIDSNDLAAPTQGSGIVPLAAGGASAAGGRREGPAAAIPRIATQPKIVVPKMPAELQYPRPERRSRTPVVIAVAAVVALAGGAAAAWQLGMFDTGDGGDPESPAVAVPVAGPPVVPAAVIDAARVPVVAVAVADARGGGDARSVIVPDSGPAAGSAGSAAQVAVQTTPTTTGDLAIRSTPAGAHAFLDGSDAGVSPVVRPGTPDRRSVVLYAPGYDLYIGKVDGHGALDVALHAAPATTGDAGIKVIHCKDKDRYYVYVDGKPSGQTCPTEQRINCSVGPHVVEVYDVQTGTKRSWNITVTDTRLSFRVRVDPD